MGIPNIPNFGREFFKEIYEKSKDFAIHYLSNYLHQFFSIYGDMRDTHNTWLQPFLLPEYLKEAELNDSDKAPEL